KKLNKHRKKMALQRRRNQALKVVSPQSEGQTISAFSLQEADPRVRDVLVGPFTIAGEQYQNMRAELILKTKAGINSLIVTSAVPKEGKTFIACCLAGTLGKDQGKKVLLVDADLRTANASHVIGLEEGRQSKGLCDVLAGKADVENCIIPCTDLNLFLL